jgi:hypothetical protein
MLRLRAVRDMAIGCRAASGTPEQVKLRTTISYAIDASTRRVCGAKLGRRAIRQSGVEKRPDSGLARFTVRESGNAQRIWN